MWTGAVALEAAAMHGIPVIFWLLYASAAAAATAAAVVAAAVDAATGGVGDSDEFDRAPVGEYGTGELLGDDMCL